MKKVTLAAAICVTIIIAILSVAINSDAFIAMINEYGAAYIFGMLFGEFLIVLFVVWVIEKIVTRKKKVT